MIDEERIERLIVQYVKINCKTGAAELDGKWGGKTVFLHKKWRSKSIHFSTISLKSGRGGKCPLWPLGSAAPGKSQLGNNVESRINRFCTDIFSVTFSEPIATIRVQYNGLKLRFWRWISTWIGKHWNFEQKKNLSKNSFWDLEHKLKFLNKWCLFSGDFSFT